MVELFENDAVHICVFGFCNEVVGPVVQPVQ